ncbi:hypothetical protein SAMN05421827_109148 [Pedobacter terrae]|uniref:Uncharacterized protein n=1 Tax=Pedobacter terrae TaxID=405671 RepID=A0A1G7W8P3_9SPHI|nr:hypothetical protein [Pedobacter terrae]SDG68311.1 hypothetical protein SAMN05421827_109148 [Pedobacter terrae]
MATPVLLARIKNLILTEAEWLLEDFIPHDGETIYVRFYNTDGTSYVNIKVGDGLKPFSQLEYNLELPAKPEAGIKPGDNHGELSKPMFWFAEPGQYANFGNQEITGAAGVIVWNGSQFSSANFNIDLNNYVKSIELLPDFLLNKEAQYSADEKIILNAIKALSIQPVDDEKLHDWIILQVNSNPRTIILRNLTAAANWYLIPEDETVPTEQTGITFYNGETEYSYADALFKYNVGIDWSLLPIDFTFDNNGTNLHVITGIFSDSANLLDKLDVENMPSYLKEKNRKYSRLARKVISATPVFDIMVPNAFINDDWRFHAVATNAPVSPLDASYKFAIEIRNLSTSTAYMIVQYNQPQLIIDELQGLKSFEGRAWSANGMHFIDFNVRIDFKALGANFQYVPNASSELKLVVGNNDKVSGVRSGFYNSQIRYPNSWLNGLRVNYYGTSIWALSYDLPAAILKNGGFPINEAISSGCARSGVPKYPGEKRAWPIILRAMGDTIAEKVYILANWDSIYKALATGDGLPAPPDRAYFEGQHEVEAIKRGITDAEFYIQCSYEHRIVPYLDGTNPMPDSWLFAHGYNERPNPVFETDENYLTQPENPEDKTTFLGAMNFYIGMILKANPYARIAIVGHYENQLNPIVSKAQTAVAEHWGIPILKTWKKTGWSQNRIKGTQHLWTDDPGRAAYAGVDGTDPDKDITVLQYWIPDNIHPATSAQAQNLLLDIQAEWLSSLY